MAHFVFGMILYVVDVELNLFLFSYLRIGRATNVDAKTKSEFSSVTGFCIECCGFIHYTMYVYICAFKSEINSARENYRSIDRRNIRMFSSLNIRTFQSCSKQSVWYMHVHMFSSNLSPSPSAQ